MDVTTDGEEVADALDGLARAASKFRRVIPFMSLHHLELIAACCPYDGEAQDALVQMETWAVVAAAELRNVAALIDGLTA